jgi:hypothetical protein
VCNDVLKEQTFIETAYSKELKISSVLLSSFYGKPTSINAAVVLPKEYDSQPGRRFPVLYLVSGYGGDYHRYSNSAIPNPQLILPRPFEFTWMVIVL